jgi:hypothetical protein
MTFTIFQTKTTPLAEFRDGYLQIKGKSVPFNYPDVYDTIRDRMKLYMKKPNRSTTIDFNLSAINAVSKRSIFKTFRIFELMKKRGIPVQVNWYYQPDNEDVLELGEICKASFDIEMQIKPTI